MQTMKLYVQLYENNIETGLEKKKSFSQPPPPPSPEIPRPLTPPPLRNFQSLLCRAGGMDIFWNYTIQNPTCEPELDILHFYQVWIWVKIQLAKAITLSLIGYTSTCENSCTPFRLAVQLFFTRENIDIDFYIMSFME